MFSCLRKKSKSKQKKVAVVAAIVVAVAVVGAVVALLLLLLLSLLLSFSLLLCSPHQSVIMKSPLGMFFPMDPRVVMLAWVIQARTYHFYQKTKRNAAQRGKQNKKKKAAN